MSLIEAFTTAQNFDTICLSETLKFVLSSSTDINDTKINLNGYSLLRADHPSKTKCDGVCMYYEDCLTLIRRTSLIFGNV